MLFETICQWQIFLSVFYFGLICGMFLELKILIGKQITFKLFNTLLDIFYCVICGFLFIKSVNLFNYGEFRLYLLISFCLGIVIEHKSVGFLLEKVFIFIYNLVTKMFSKLKKFKLFAKLFK